jgi:hypothetical protein
MITASQMAANQHNAQSSTGPRTGEGKAASSQNSTSHGLSSEFALLSHENSAEFNELFNQSVQEFQPSGIHQEFLVRRMVEARWRAARCQRLEKAAFESMIAPDAADLSPDARIISKMQGRGDIITLLQRYTTAALSQYDKAYRELIQGRKQQFKHEQQAVDHYIKSVVFAPTPGEAAAAAKSTAEAEPPAPPRSNGFVSQIAPAGPKPSIAASLGNLALRL